MEEAGPSERNDAEIGRLLRDTIRTGNACRYEPDPGRPITWILDADSASFTLSIENVPSENPKTGRIVALSVIATLRKLAAPLRVGT